MLRAAYAHPAGNELAGDGFTRFSLPLFEHVRQHRLASGIHREPRGWATVHEHLRHIMQGVIAGEMDKDSRRHRPGSDGIPPDLFAQHVASTFLLVLEWWVGSQSPLAPRELNELFRRLAVPASLAPRDNA